jgi:nuclear receptor-binding protein
VTLTPAIDIFAFGMCALETAALELTTTGENGAQILVTPEAVQKSIESLEDELQKDFIRKCLITDPLKRPKARELLFHPVLFEVHSLKLLAAHSLVKNPGAESMTDEAIHKYYGNNTIMASLSVCNEDKCYRLTDFPVHEKLEKFMEDVKYGIYPLTAFIAQPQPAKTRPPSPESCKSDKSSSLEPQDVESRRIQTMQCSVQANQDKKDLNNLGLRILLRMEDNMNRQLYCTIVRGVDTAPGLAAELVQHGFIHAQDSEAIVEMLAKAIVKYDQEGNTFEILKQEDLRTLVVA